MKEGKSVVCRKMYGIGDHCVKCNKPILQKQL
jgi:hypothetical protein